MTVFAAEGPYFDEMQLGDRFDTAPPMTLTDGAAAVHQSIVGERLRLSLDTALSRRVTGGEQRLAPPSLVWDVAIGQSTLVTQHVRANLFYRGLSFRRAPAIGDTLRSSTEVVGLKQNAARADGAASGLVALRIITADQHGRTVLDFWRCAMLPLRDPRARTGHTDDLSEVGVDIDSDQVIGVVRDWRLGDFRQALPESLRLGPDVGNSWRIIGGDVVSSAPELARLTLNVARTHHDDVGGTRLVYGGHIVGIALTQALRAIPQIVTVLAWHACDHMGPVREGDTITSMVTVERVELIPDGGRLIHLRSRASARSSSGDTPRDVLDWRFVGLLS